MRGGNSRAGEEGWEGCWALDENVGVGGKMRMMNEVIERLAC